MGRVRVGWATTERATTERTIRDALGGLELVNATIDLATPVAGDGPLEFEGRGASAIGAVSGPVPVLVGLGWATVDRERAAEELTDSIPGLLARGFVPAPRDPYLGAHALVAAGPADDEASPRLVLLEPDTEGRLAAVLARHGEGPVALYVARDDPDAAGPGSPAGPVGPLGPGRLVATPGRFGPFLVVLGGAERVPSAP